MLTLTISPPAHPSKRPHARPSGRWSGKRRFAPSQSCSAVWLSLSRPLECGLFPAPGASPAAATGSCRRGSRATVRRRWRDDRAMARSGSWSAQRRRSWHRAPRPVRHDNYMNNFDRRARQSDSAVAQRGVKTPPRARHASKRPSFSPGDQSAVGTSPRTPPRRAGSAVRTFRSWGSRPWSAARYCGW
jgi:hypothetical protein